MHILYFFFFFFNHFLLLENDSKNAILNNKILKTVTWWKIYNLTIKYNLKTAKLSAMLTFSEVYRMSRSQNFQRALPLSSNQNSTLDPLECPAVFFGPASQKKAFHCLLHLLAKNGSSFFFLEIKTVHKAW